MKFNSQDFAAVFAEEVRSIPKRSKLGHLKQLYIKHVHGEQGSTTHSIAPPSPPFGGFNPDVVDSEPFPDFTDLSEPGTFQPESEHCIVHCQHETCLELKDQEKKKHSHLVSECKCAIERKTPCATLPGPPLQLTDEFLHYVSGAYHCLSATTRITVHEADAQSFLTQLKTRFEHHPHFMQLAQEIQRRLPGRRAVLATGKAYITFFQDVSKFFTRVIELHGGDTHAWTVSVGELHAVWRNCMYATMTDFIEEHFPQMLEQKMRPPGVMKDYVDEGVPKFVWEFWMGLWEVLVKVLVSRDRQLAQIAAGSAGSNGASG